MTENKKLFGTDGIRGQANVHPMTGEIAMALGRAVTYYFQKQNDFSRKSPLIIIGKDTRLSCYMLEQAFAAGVCSQGGRAIFTGPLPTPGVAFATVSMRADAGVMISASHNQFSDNGIKIFDDKGQKLPDSIEKELENLILSPELLEQKTGDKLGKAKRLDEVIGRYIVHVKNGYCTTKSLAGLRLVIDCANGAAYKVAPMVFEELGAEVISTGVAPNGVNINKECGALYPKKCAELVKHYRADLGICLDGDADRLIMVNEKGEVVDGDLLIGVLGKYLHDNNNLGEAKEVVGTVMTNSGLEAFFKNNNINFFRAKVGDRYISERMLQNGSLFGGEPSGHLIFRNHSTTGDGILAALKVIECIRGSEKSLSELTKEITLYPQVLMGVKVTEKKPLEEMSLVQNKILEIEKKLSGMGRVLFRYSGTENLARVMVEGKNLDEITTYCNEICEQLKLELL